MQWNTLHFSALQGSAAYQTGNKAGRWLTSSSLFLSLHRRSSFLFPFRSRSRVADRAHRDRLRPILLDPAVIFVADFTVVFFDLHFLSSIKVTWRRKSPTTTIIHHRDYIQQLESMSGEGQVSLTYDSRFSSKHPRIKLPTQCKHKFSSRAG